MVKNTALLKALIEDLVYEGTIIPLPGDRAHNIKLDTVLEEDSKEEKNDGAAKLKDNTFNTPITLEKYINFAIIIKESKNKSYF